MVSDPLERNAKSPLDKRAVLALVAACLLLLIQAVTLMRTRWVEDESWLSNGAWTLLKEGSLRMPIFPADTSFQVDVSLPLERLSMLPVFAAFGLGEIQGRSVSALAAIATVVVVFLLAYQLAGPLCAAAAAVLLATDTFLVIAARTVRPEAEATLLCWLSLLLGYISIRHNSLRLALASGLMGGLALLCHPLGLAFVAAMGLYYVWEQGTVRRQSMACIFAIGVAVSIVPYLGWCFSNPAHVANFQSVYVSRTHEPLMERVVGELDRWSDFIGLGSQRVPLPLHIPVRIHIVAAIAAAFIFLLRGRRKLALCLLALFLINVVWWIYMVNKGPRYIVVVAPLFAILLGCALASSATQRTRMAWAVVAGVIAVTQLAGNFYWIYKYRNADYPSVARELRAAIPPDASVYSITTFWLALYDRTYYAYDRTPFEFARDRLKPDYLILNDRVMVQGSGHGEDNFRDLRQKLTRIVRQRGFLVGRISNDFYGNLEIYRVSW